MFEYKTTVKAQEPGEDGEMHEVDRDITLRFKSFGDAPGRISRYNQGNIERQLWLTMEWGLVEPKHWPENSDLPGHLVLDELTQRDITECYSKWQRHDDEEDEDKDK